MWYFAWILGLGFALALGILNAMWLEVRDCQRELDEESPGGSQKSGE